MLRIFKNNLVTRGIKLKVYYNLVRPVDTHGSEVWTLTENDKTALKSFERKILRKIYGPVREEGSWRIRNNNELQALMHGKDIVKFIKSQRLCWLGHVERMLKGRLYTTRRRGRPRMRWLDGVTEDLASMRIREWRRRAENKEAWRNIVEEAKAHQRL